MISKVIAPGKSFNRLCQYLFKSESNSHVIDAQGVRDYNHKLMAADFEYQRSLNPGLKSPVMHMILSYYPGEIISDEKMTEIAKEYLKDLNIANTQYAFVRHNDRDHPHTHIVINRVDNDGKTIKDNWIGLRGKKVAQQLTLKHELKQAQKKTLELTHLERLNEYEATRYQIYQAICDVLPKCRNLDELKSRLEKQKIEMLYKYKGQTNEVQGVSFKQGEFKFKGSEIDRQHSVKNLEKAIAQNLNLNQSQKQRIPLSKTQKKTIGLMLEMQRSRKTSLIEELMRPELTQGQTPHELLKKKRKSKRHHL